jgi:hypothetical protein
MPRLEPYVLNLLSPAELSQSYYASDQVLAYVIATTHRTMTLGRYQDEVIHRITSNCGDEADNLDLSVRKHEQPFSAQFSPSRLPAILRAANERMYEEHERKGEALPALSVVAMTTVHDRLAVASVGLDVALYRVRAKRIDRLTPRPAFAGYAVATGLGQTPEADVHVHSGDLAPDDIYVLSIAGWA